MWSLEIIVVHDQVTYDKLFLAITFTWYIHLLLHDTVMIKIDYMNYMYKETETWYTNMCVSVYDANDN